MASFAEVPYSEIVRTPYCNDAIERNDFPGFREDYLTLHSLIRCYRPTRIVEIGTSAGAGTNVICRAMGLRRRLGPFDRRRSQSVISIDVPPGTDPAVIYPEREDGHPERAGEKCRFPYTQLFGDSTTYDFSPYYPIDAWFIDGKHSYDYVAQDTAQALKAQPGLIIWHDMQIESVAAAVADTMTGQPYRMRVVTGTRIGYAVEG